ncbi:hypothetical protein V8C86DRAFT_3084010 [Haematococcus lacustris]
MQADKKLDVWALPHLLVVHLKRFSYTRSSRDKLETPVLFGQELDLGPYVLAHPPTAAAPPGASHAPQSPCASLPLVDDGKAAAPGAAAAPAGAAASVGDIAMPDASANISAVSSGTQLGGRGAGAGAGAGVEAGAGSEVVGGVSEGSGPCPQLYQLYAVINHYGSLGGGHYTAFVQEPGSSRWFAYDDSRVTPVSIEEVCSPAAYVLFFRRKDDAARDPPDLLARLQDGQARLHQEAGLCLQPTMNGQAHQPAEDMHGKPLQPGSPSPSHPIAHHARQHATSSLPMFDDEDEQQQGEGRVGDAGKVGDCSQPQPPQLGLGSLAVPLHAPQRSSTGLECGGGSAAAAAAAAAAQGGSRGDPAWPSAAQALSGLAGGAANLISAAVSRLQGQAGCWVGAGGGAGGAAGPGPGPGPAALMPGTPDASDSAPTLPMPGPGPLSIPAPPAPPLAGPELPHGLRCHAVPGSNRSHVGVTGGGESVTSLPGTPSVDTPGRGGPASTCVAQCSRLGWQAGGSLASVQVSDDQGSHQGRAQEMCDLGDDGDLSLYRDMEYTGEGGEDLEQQGGGLGGGQPRSCPDLMGGLQDMDMQAEPFAAGTGGQGAWQLGATSGSGQGGEAAALELTSLGVRAAAGSAR